MIRKGCHFSEANWLTRFAGRFMLVRCRCYHRLLMLSKFVTVFTDDVPHFLNMLPRMQHHPLCSLSALIRMLERFERVRSAGLFLPRFFLLHRHVLPIGHHARDAFVRVFLVLALPLAVRLWLMRMKSRVSFLTVATASYFLPSRRRKAASLSWVWSMCLMAVSRRRADRPTPARCERRWPR